MAEGAGGEGPHEEAHNRAAAGGQGGGAGGSPAEVGGTVSQDCRWEPRPFGSPEARGSCALGIPFVGATVGKTQIGPTTASTATATAGQRMKHECRREEHIKSKCM